MDERIRPVHMRHRQRLRTKYERDEATMCDHELLELFLFDAVPRHNTNPMAHAFLDRFGSLLSVFTADKSELMKIPGVGESVAAYIKETYRKYSESLTEALRCENAVGVGQIHNYLIWHRMNESAVLGHDRYITVVALDRKMRITDIYDTDGSDVAGVAESERSRGTFAVIIGVGEVTEDIRQTVTESDFVFDVVTVNGTVAKSFRDESCGESVK